VDEKPLPSPRRPAFATPGGSRPQSMYEASRQGSGSSGTVDPHTLRPVTSAPATGRSSPTLPSPSAHSPTETVGTATTPGEETTMLPPPRLRMRMPAAFASTSSLAQPTTPGGGGTSTPGGTRRAKWTGVLRDLPHPTFPVQWTGPMSSAAPTPVSDVESDVGYFNIQNPEKRALEEQRLRKKAQKTKRRKAEVYVSAHLFVRSGRAVDD
jgi:hypothetical protein